jgi:hypothetical protein
MKITFRSILIISFFHLISISSCFSSEIQYSFDKKISSSDQKLINQVFSILNEKLPTKFKEGLSSKLSIKIEDVKGQTSFPVDICDQKESEVRPLKILGNNKKFFTVEYNKDLNQLRINRILLNTIIDPNSSEIASKCSLKNVFLEAEGVLIHSLAHVFDNQNGLLSESDQFVSQSDFKKSGLRLKLKNDKSEKSLSIEEKKSVSEYFATHFEYFVLDENYACRKPLLFNYFKNLFEFDPYPSRKCELNHIVMMSSKEGLIPIDLDPSRVYRIDYLLASPGSDLSSGFGHSMFRLVICAPKRLDPITGKILAATPFSSKCLEDKMYHLVVSFRAEVNDENSNYLKGIFGKYPSMLFILSFPNVLDEYNKDEMRDLISYPLTLNDKTRNEIVTKIIEEHWDYRGSYKFFTNNCAVESLDLLKGQSIGHLDQNGSVTPKGVLDDLVSSGVVDSNSSLNETYKASTDELLSAINLTYGQSDKKSKLDHKNGIKRISKFVSDSKAQERRNSYLQFKDSKMALLDLHAEIFELKKRLAKSASFSVIEQQVLRTKSNEYKKLVSKLITESNDQDIQAKIKQMQTSSSKNLFINNNSYGVPLVSEIKKSATAEESIKLSRELNQFADKLFQEKYPHEFTELNLISTNIVLMNEYSIELRKNYKTKLDNYVYSVIRNLLSSDEGIKVLVSIRNNENDAFLKIRQTLDPNLVSISEISDFKILKIVSEFLNN